MRIQAVIEELAELDKSGLVQGYAIGGAVGATFYLEPVSTVDVDVFVGLQAKPGRVIADPTPILEFLTSRGAVMEGEHVVIGGWPVQILATGDPLTDEALERAVEVDVDGTPARVFRAEHLAALALRTGRAKDKARLLQFIEQQAMDRAAFEAIVNRYDLGLPWSRFRSAFLEETP